ncbi:MAG: hypothetical protein K2O29_01210 [Ruminococcus sp.]|nr:hypothetical protein [Ruminococcus sp.]MDE7137066.1 hypothetical protein [Ruminococcus sp.]
MFRMLKISIAVISIILGIFALSVYLFKDAEAGFVISILICTDIYFSWLFLSAIRQQAYITKLHKKGCRTNGTLIAVTYEDRGRNHISYQVDGKDYKCENGRKFGKWKVGYDKIPLLYNPEHPENNCLEKYDLVSAISNTVAFSVLEAIFIGCTIYTIICFI